MGEIVTYPSNGHQASGYLTGSSGPGVIVIQEWWGLNDNIKAIADQFAAAGFVALAPDLYHGEVASAPDDARRLAMNLEMSQAAKDMSGAVDYLLGKADGNKLGVVGFCLGGGLALTLAAQRPDVISAAAPFYGLPRQLEELDWQGMTAKVQGHYGELDQGIKAENVRAFEARLKALSKDVDISIYEGANHAFFNETGRNHHPEIAKLAWEKTVAFLRTELT
ncbi:MAG: dienelactone hydrolase family protein [Trueperaceae bacterium]|nr:dienelactone hydrolase family protein [Trueperaceae bacterium]